MPRRSKKTSPLEDFTELVALLPWWACLLVALFAYALLHSIAARPIASGPAQPGQLGALVAGSLLSTFASLGQFVVPILCVAAAIVSAVRRHHRHDLAERVATSDDRAALDRMTWADFELLVGEAYRREGYTVVERGGAGPDGGVDLTLHKDGAEYFVQCKQWKTFMVGVDIVRQLKGVVSAHGAQGGFVITSGQFTSDAIAFAHKANIVLVDGVKLHAMIRSARPPRVDPTIRDQEEQLPTRSVAPTCPICASIMVKRAARRGSNAGSSFWGCPKFPACRGTRQI